MGERAVGLLQGLGYTNVRHYLGGMAEWVEAGGPVEAMEQPPPMAAPMRARAVTPPHASWSSWLDVFVNCSLEQLVYFWLGMIIVFGFTYWLASIAMGWGLQAGSALVRPDIRGLGTAIYFSFVTALSIGYGDVVPLGPLRILAIAEGIAGLLTFGFVVSKLVSRRQEELVAEIHRTTFDDRLDRVRTNLHLVFADLETIGQINRERSMLPDQILKRLESSVRVFTGELKTIHDLLYRTQVLPEEDALESLLANLALCLTALSEFLKTQSPRSASLEGGLRTVSNLANEICGECVPRDYAPELKELMDQIKALAKNIA